MIQNETPTLSKVVTEAIEARLTDLHVALPGRVEKFDKTTMKADIQPLLQRKFANGDLVDLPVITDVPVMFPRTASAIISMPLKKDDTGLIICSERSLDTWVLKGGIVDPKDTRKHDLSDGVFIPGLFPFSQPSMAEDDVILLKNGLLGAALRIKNDGKFQLKNETSGFELISLLVDTLTEIISLTVLDPLSGALPLTPDKVTAFTELKVKLETLKG